MIKTKEGYKQTLKWIEEFEQVAQNLQTELAHNPKLLKLELTGIKTQIADLRKQARQYENKFLNIKKAA